MIREIEAKALSAAVRTLCIEANTILPQDLRTAICKAGQDEPSPVGQAILGDLVENYQFAQSKGLPICQDTGMAVVFLDWGQDCHLTGGCLEDAVNEGVRRGYLDGHLRLSVVGDPLRRANTNDNTPAILHLRMVPGNQVDITVAPKGFGSENMSRIAMLKPSDGVEGVKDFIVDTVEQAGPNPCPPIVVGVGLGGTFDKCALLAKKALLRELGTPSPLPFYAELERELLDRINALGIGPQGFGGRTTALAVHIETLPTHIAGLPCAVNINCHVARHATEVL